MNKKTTAKLLLRKHKDFVASITDPGVRALVEKNSIITGGSIASMLLQEKVNDYDYYFTDKETVIAVANYYVKKFIEKHPECEIKPTVQVIEDRVKVIVKSAGLAAEGVKSGYQYFESRPIDEGEEYVEQATQGVTEADNIPAEKMEELGGYWKSPVGENHGLNSYPGDVWIPAKDPYRPIFMTSNAITLSNHVQLIIRFYGNAEEIHKNYDFVHCTNYWLSGDGKLYLNQAALESLLSKTLQYVGSLYPVSSVIRTRKFIKNGWHINAGQYLKMLFQVSELDLKNIETLEEQLTGVDCAYFFEIIEYFKKRQEEDKEFQISMPYLASIVDKIF